MPTSRSAHPPAAQGKTILVLDDEPDVRRLVAIMLSSNGYKVLTASNGESAIKIFQRSKQPIDLALLDVVSPGMSGPMVADRLTELKPELPVLYMSGYDHTNVVQRYIVEKGHALIPKPFTEKQLAKKVHEVIHGDGIG